MQKTQTCSVVIVWVIRAWEPGTPHPYWCDELRFGIGMGDLCPVSGQDSPIPDDDANDKNIFN